MWYGETLESIERNYGCVAEYNRCMAEREMEEYEPTEEELAEEERRMAEYNAEIERLNGEPSEFIKSLVAEWEEKKPEHVSEPYNEYVASIYAGYEWARERTLDIVEKIRLHYGVEVNEEWETFYRPPEGRFAIEVEYTDGCHIKHKHIGNLYFEQFKAIFRDLVYARLWPSMKYGDMIRSNCTLGSLLMYELKEVA